MFDKIDTHDVPHGSCVVSGQHPADERQGRGLDHLAGPSYFASVAGWLVAGVVACIMWAAIIIMGDHV